MSCSHMPELDKLRRKPPRVISKLHTQAQLLEACPGESCRMVSEFLGCGPLLSKGSQSEGTESRLPDKALRRRISGCVNRHSLREMTESFSVFSKQNGI